MMSTLPRQQVIGVEVWLALGNRLPGFQHTLPSMRIGMSFGAVHAVTFSVTACFWIHVF
jgi:hypothetical protein